MSIEIKLVPLDYAILALLPEEGTTLGFSPLAKQAKGIVRDLNDQLATGEPAVQSSWVNGRLRALKVGGYVIDCAVQPVGKGRGWQRTAKGRSLAVQAAEHPSEGQTI